MQFSCHAIVMAIVKFIAKPAQCKSVIWYHVQKFIKKVLLQVQDYFVNVLTRIAGRHFKRVLISHMIQALIKVQFGEINLCVLL